MMRDVVKKWIRKYPIFDAIDLAASEHGLRIMAMLYLTPILPLGPVSYMCGTTSLKLSHFVLAKIAALPLMMLYVLIGASTGTLISAPPTDNNISTTTTTTQSIENNELLIVSGIVLSLASIAGITHYIKKELNQILERQKRELESNGNINNNSNNNSSNNSGGSGAGIEFSHLTTTTSASSQLLNDLEGGDGGGGGIHHHENNFIHILENGGGGMSTPSTTPKVTASSTTTMEPEVLPVTTTTTTTVPRQRKH